MNRSAKLALVIGIILLVWAAAFTMTASASSDGHAAELSDPPIFALQPPPTTYTLTVSINPSGGGSVTKNPDLPVYISGTVVALTPMANSGYVFSSWTNCDSVVGTICNMTMNANKIVTATFAASLTPTITATATGTATATRTATWTATATRTATVIAASPTFTLAPTVTSTTAPLATITPLFGGAVATVTAIPTPASALPSTGASPLIWIAAGLVLVLIVIGARYLRQSST